jgi:hypothetical protein
VRDARGARRRGRVTAHACLPEATGTFVEGAEAGGGKGLALAGACYRRRRLRPAFGTTSALNQAPDACSVPRRLLPELSTLDVKGGAGGDVLPG